MSAEHLDINKITKEEIEDYEATVLAEICRDAYGSDPLTSVYHLQIVRFTSRREFGRERKQPVEVVLLVVDGTTAYLVKHGDIKPRRKKDKAIGPDRLADQVLEYLPREDRTTERLLEEILIRNGGLK